MTAAERRLCRDVEWRATMANVRSGVCLAVLAAAAVAVMPVAHVEARQAPRTVTLTVTDPVGEKMNYSQKQILAKPGEKLKVRLVSMAQTPKIVMAHNFVVLKAGTDIKKFTDAAANARATDFIPPAFKASIIAMAGMVGPGESMEVTFTAPTAPGKYTFLCSFAGHYAAGMWGELIVK
jgi:azurin